MKKQEQKVHEKVILLGKFYEEFGRDPRPKEEYNEVKIGSFLHNIRQKRIKINMQDKKYLEGLGIRLFSRDRKNQIHEKVIALGNFYKEFGRDPKRKEEYDGIKIGNFLGSVRVGNTKLTKEDETFLKKIGVKITKGVVQERIHEKVILLGKFYQEYGREPKQREEYCGLKIGTFLASIRTKNTKISKVDSTYLKKLGFKM